MKRISATEMLFVVGVEESLVTVDQCSCFPDGAPVTDLDCFSPNVEAIAAFEPDIVLMRSSGEVW